MFSTTGVHQGFNLYAAPQVSLIDQKLNEARQERSPMPFKGVINYVDMWFNLRNNPQLPIRISDELKWQLYFLAGAMIDSEEEVKFIDPTGRIDANYFSIDHLSINDLVLFFRIIISIGENQPDLIDNTESYEQAAFRELMRKIPQRIESLCRKDVQTREQVVSKFEEQRDPNLQQIIGRLREMKTEDELALEAMERSLEYLLEEDEENAVQVQMAIMDCFRAKNPVLNLSQIRLRELTRDIQYLSHVQTIYLNLDEDFNASREFGEYSHIRDLKNVKEVGFLTAPFTPEKVSLHNELNKWCNEVQGQEEYWERVRISCEIVRNYIAQEPRLELNVSGVTTLPACLKALVHLTELSLVECKFTKFPESVLHLANLERFSLVGKHEYWDTRENQSECEIAAVPKEIANLVKLEEFVIRYTKITTLPPEMASIPVLRKIEAQANQITFVPDTFARLSKDCEVALYDNPLNVQWLEYFDGLLQSTRAQNSHLVPWILKADDLGPDLMRDKREEEDTLEEIRWREGSALRDVEWKLEALREEGNEAAVQAQLVIIDCLKTKDPVLNLSQIKLSEVPDSIRYLSHVQTIYLNLDEDFDASRGFDEYYSPLQNLKNVKEVGFLAAPFTDEKIKLHNELTQWCQEVQGQEEYWKRVRVSYEIVRSYTTQNPRLELDLSGAATLPACLKDLVHLTSLTLIECGLTTFPESVLHLVNLQEFTLAGKREYNWMTDEARLACTITAVPKEITNLKKLERFVIGHTKITTLPPEMVTISTLTYIDVRNNQITFVPDVFVTAISRNCEEIYLSDNPLNEQWVEYFRSLMDRTREQTLE